jgi:hypothetical protein
MEIIEAGHSKKHGRRLKRIFEGKNYYSYPDSEYKSNRYFKRAHRWKENGKWKYRGILLHRIIYEFYHNVKLTSKDCVHHINGNCLDNSIENLEITTQSEHLKGHHLKEPLNCSICGKDFFASILFGTSNRFCSRKCYIKSDKCKEYDKKYQKEYHKGEKNLKYQKAYYLRKKQEISEKHKAYRLRKKQEILEYQKAYRLRKKQEKLLSQGS